MGPIIEVASTDDSDAIIALLPRLADFVVPQNRTPTELWSGDAKTVSNWAAGKLANLDVWVTRNDELVIGVCMVSYRDEMLSGEPSAHLEVLAVDKSVEGQGMASALLQHAQAMAMAKGAKSMSLHVFANNERARALYERHGFEGELLRYFQPLNTGPQSY